MDFRNVIFALALSFAVLFGWSVIFEAPEIEKQKTWGFDVFLLKLTEKKTQQQFFQV